jgi:pescadillo protein
VNCKKVFNDSLNSFSRGLINEKILLSCLFKKRNIFFIFFIFRSNKPRYSLDHIVRERYPTFIDAIRDLEDCLCLCFLYSTFPKNPKTPIEMVTLCRRLCIEFLHYVIEFKALRKVFVSIKGYYYQAEIMGQTVTWVIPHPFSYDHPQGVDLRLMSIFVEFYTTMLGFVNFRLYHNLNLQYPPSLSGTVRDHMPDQVDQDQDNAEEQDNNKDDAEETEEMIRERVSALNHSLLRTVVQADEVEMDHIPTGSDDESKLEAAREEAANVKKLQILFKGKKFFLGREIPREPLVFMVRAFGGEVSWDFTAAPGSTFQADDSTITHQISDRPRDSIDMKHINRFYVQPQWVFDSINRRELLPVHKFFLGEPLPPHLSPFLSEDRRIGDYIPPEEKEMLGLAEKKEVQLVIYI